MSLVWNGREEHRVDDSLPQKDNGQPRQGGWVGVSTFCIRPQIILLHDGHRAPRALVEGMQMGIPQPKAGLSCFLDLQAHKS